MSMNGDPASLYIHVPFCKKKCPYCHFFVVQNKGELHDQFVQALLRELQLVEPQLQGRSIVSVYFGGGTPALLAPHLIATILQAISREPTCEVTLEANPGDVTQSLMHDFRSAGINRVSLGVQAFNDSLLHHLGRTHSAHDATQAVTATYKGGIDNISIDLMYEIPHQTTTLWEETLAQAITLPITHVSLYNLTFEEGSAFFRSKGKITPSLPSHDEGVVMLEQACNVLASAGFERYEISAFARNGLRSKHNTGYWTGRPFLGLGPSAFSFWEGRRFQNVCNLKHYRERIDQGIVPTTFTEQLPPAESMHERLAVRLRLFDPVPRDDFPISQELLDTLASHGWITATPSSITLTEKGRLFYDSVAEAIIL